MRRRGVSSITGGPGEVVLYTSTGVGGEGVGVGMPLSIVDGLKGDGVGDNEANVKAKGAGAMKEMVKAMGN